MGTPDAYFCDQLFDDLALDGAVLLGKGQAENPDIAKADAAQAVLAVAWRHRRTKLLDRRPKELHDLLDSFAPIHDGFTKLVSMSAPFDIEIESIPYKSGSDHDRYHAVDLVFTSHGQSFTLECDYYRTSKTGAKTRSASAAIALLHNYHEYPGDLSNSEKDFVSHYVGRQIKNISEVDDRHLQRCILQGHLGLAMLASGDMSTFRQWAKVTSTIVGTISQSERTNLQRFYERCSSQTRRGSIPITISQIASFASWLESLDPEAEASESATLTLLTEFCYYPIPDNPEDLFTVVATGAENNSISLNIEDGFEADTVRISPIQAAAVAMLINMTSRWVTSSTTIDLGNSEEGMLVLIHGLKKGFETSAGPLAELLAELSPSVTCYLGQGDLLIKIAFEEAEEANEASDTSPIEQAARAALRSASEAQQVMTALHRDVPPLIEQLQLFKTAQAASKTTNRTNCYRRLAEASEALDAMSPHVNALKRLVSRLSTQ
ncbi:hypothetical protein [Nonomuraea sp. NPDC050786]|uniref:hypothetical protein n=1 Tax=Nonomuraea sp. NPDC050786 TaxID=3154840 RepID=UPI0033E5E264